MAREIVRASHAPVPSPHVLGAPRFVSPPPGLPHTRSRVTILTPGAGDIVTVGHPVLIRWQTSCMPGLLLYYVQLSTDGGTTYPQDISPLLDGSDCRYLWVPTDDFVTPAAHIRVVAINWGEATSEGSFLILPRDRELSVPVASAWS